MKKTQKQLMRESEIKEAEVTESVKRLMDNGDFQRYLAQVAQLKERIKDEAIKEADIEVLRMYQAQHALLVSIFGFGQTAEPRGEEGE